MKAKNPAGAGFFKRSAWAIMSGKEQPLLATPPLRTVRASFPAYGSSLYKSVPKYRPATLLLLHITKNYSMRAVSRFNPLVGRKWRIQAISVS